MNARLQKIIDGMTIRKDGPSNCGVDGCDGKVCGGEPWGHPRTEADHNAELYARHPELEPYTERRERERKERMARAGRFAGINAQIAKLGGGRR